MKRRFFPLNQVFIFLLASCSTWASLGPKKAATSEAYQAPIESMPQADTSWIEGLPKILTISQEADHAIQNMSDETRKKLMILTENTSRSLRHQLKSTASRYIEVPRQDIKMDIVYNDLLSPSEKGLYKKNLEGFTLSQNRDLVKIPIHPETAAQHPFVQHFLDRGYPIKFATKTLWPTMSRSLWVWPGEGLYTIKLPTDTVNGKLEPNKLASEDDNVGLYVSPLNSLNRLVSNPYIKDHNILLLPDTVGLKVSRSSEKIQPYGVILRSYESLLQNRSYLYLPQQTVLSGQQMFSFRGATILGIVLDGGVGLNQYELDQSTAFHRIAFNAVQWRDITYDLEDKAQVLSAFLIAQGYHYSYRNFHGQNVLFGLSLKPGNKPQLVLRDLLDITDLTLTRPAQPIPDLGLSAFGLKMEYMERAFGCTGVFEDSLKRKARLDGAFLKTVRDLGWTLPQGLSWDRIKTRAEFEKILLNPAYRVHFLGEMKRTRQGQDPS